MITITQQSNPLGAKAKDETMAKGQKRSSREARKPKQPKKLPSAPVAGAGGSSDLIRATFSARRNGGKPHS